MIFNLLKVIVVAFIYGTVLVFLGPLVDHAFTDLHKEETNWEILFEIIIHIISNYLKEWIDKNTDLNRMIDDDNFYEQFKRFIYKEYVRPLENYNYSFLRVLHILYK